MKLDHIHHIAIICSDREAALEFYHNKLGFEIIRDNYREHRSDWKIDLRINENTELELFIKKDCPARLSPEAYGLRHLAFKAEDTEKAAAELEKVGIKCDPVRVDEINGGKFTFFYDPDGLPLEIHE